MEQHDHPLSTADIADPGAAPAGPAHDGDEPTARQEPAAVAEPDEAPPPAERDDAPLLEDEQARQFREEWDAIQTGFVDEPRHAVERADALVADLMQRLAETFAGERRDLESQWDRGDDVDTEDLRVALQRYRSFFGRLLNA